MIDFNLLPSLTRTIIVLFAFNIKKLKKLPVLQRKCLIKIGFYIRIIKYDYLLRIMTKMAKHNYKKSKLKYVLLASVCATAFAFSGIAAACGNDSSDEKDDDKTVAKEDTQLLKNGNFEIFTVPEKKEGGNEPLYLIKTPENWTRGGTSSYTMSGIISTSETAWDKMTDENLEADLDYNNKLDSSSSDYLNQYIDYNGMKSSDVLYKNQYEALRDDYKEDEEPPADRKDRIENPQTHYNVTKKDGKLVCTIDGKEQPVYEDAKGEYFLEYDEDKDEYKQPISNVLMLHNYATSRNGIAQTYSSVEVELPANTAAEISLWVKTSYLRFSQGKDVTQDRGANVSVTQTVGSSTIDKFTISCINTEKLLGKGIYKDETAVIEDKYNGWVEYTVYVNACDFASSKIKLELGLGESGYTTEGYAFFDDVKVTKYASLNDSDSYIKNKDKLDKDNTCNLSSDASEKIFKADSYKRNDGNVSEERNSKDFHYYIDLASERSDGQSEDTTYKPVSFADAKVGYTVDSDNYVSSKKAISDSNLINFTSDNVIAVDSSWKLPFTNKTEFGPINTGDDRLALVNTTSSPFKSSQTKYADRLNLALASAATLPKNSAANHNNMLVLLSAYGAAYTASFDLNIDAEGYKIVSFWVKTSDMNGSTAATVKITELVDGKKNDDNTAQITLDTTDKVTNIGTEENEKDIFDGWVQCFFFVKNELNKSADFTIDFSFGNTTISGTDVHSYKYGYAALANMQTLNVDEDIFAYTGSGDNTATLTIVEDEEKQTHVFDDAYGSLSHTIKNDMVIPASYKGVNGGSSAVTNNKFVSLPYDDINNNYYFNADKKTDCIFTGLINKDNFKDGNYLNTDWYKSLAIMYPKTSSMSALDYWYEIFGRKSVQPLIIYNKMRTSYVEERDANKDNFTNYYIKDENGVFNKVSDTPNAKFDEKETYYSSKDVMNYGYIGEDSSVSANSYATISVRVKVSKGAVAYIYLVDTSAGKKVHKFSAPSYSFYYDVEGNVLKAEPKKNATITEQRENVLYTLREDGLYEDRDGKLFANTWNYGKSYYDESITYYDKNGNAFSIEDLEDGVVYYSDKTATVEANHYLVTTSGDKIYEYKDGNYYYIVEGKTQSDIITPFETKYARYNYDNLSEDYTVEIKGSEHSDWVTVNFIVHAGSAAKSYRLELWSGQRENATQADNKEGEFVMFDYSYLTVSDDTLRTDYENDIIKQYQSELAKIGKLENIASNDKNIAYYEKLAKDNKITVKTDYEAHYYTYSLYDSADFKPFNKTVADENASGYDYSVSDQSESLAYLRVNEDDAITVFTDYTNIDKTVTLNEGNDDTTDDDTTTDEEDKGSDGSIWLLASSIILVVALVFAIIAIFLKDFIKKRRRNKVTSKNNYNQRRTNRYKRKLGLKNEEIVEVENTSKPDEAETDATANDETPVEETPAEEEKTEESADDAAPEVEEAKDEAPVEETPAPDAEEKAEEPEEKPEDTQE